MDMYFVPEHIIIPGTGTEEKGRSHGYIVGILFEFFSLDEEFIVVDPVPEAAPG